MYDKVCRKVLTGLVFIVEWLDVEWLVLVEWLVHLELLSISVLLVLTKLLPVRRRWIRKVKVVFGHRLIRDWLVRLKKEWRQLCQTNVVSLLISSLNLITVATQN